MELEKERRGAIQILRINRPEARNSLNGAVINGLGFGIQEANADPEIRAVIITAVGDKAFCAGMDLRDFATGSGGASEENKRGLEAFVNWQRNGVDVPVIGAANATAVAGGFEVLLACDMIIANEDAKFGLPEVKRSLVAAGGGVFIGRRIPIAHAYELTLTGDQIDAKRALALGLINEAVPADQVLERAINLAERIVANGPLAVQATKKLVRAATELSPNEVWKMQDKIAPTVFGSEDAKEGATAFIEKRPPVWKGR